MKSFPASKGGSRPRAGRFRNCSMGPASCGGGGVRGGSGGGREHAGPGAGHRLTSLVDALAKTLHVNKPARLSIGVAHLSDLKTPSPEVLLQNADKALYRVKADRKRTLSP